MRSTTGTGGNLTRGFVCFDIETTDLKANFGNIIGAVLVPLYGGQPEVFRLDDKRYRSKDSYDDSKLVKALAKSMEEATCWIGWNSKMFDVAFINTRLMHAGLPPLEKRMHIDLMWYARRPNMALHSSRLESVMDFLHLENRKSKVDPEIWVEAKALKPKAMEYVVTHCKADTYALKEAFEYLKPFIGTIHR